MAHIVFATRGIKHVRDMFVSSMQSQIFPWTRKNLETGKMETLPLQGALRPLELWEYVVPEEVVPEALAMLGLNEDPQGSSSGVLSNAKFMQAKSAMLRKTLGLEKMPHFPEVTPNRWIARQGMAIHPIGYKKDEKRDFDFSSHGGGKYHQEAL